MNIYLTRHGETNYNIKGLCNNDPNVDVHLTKKGIYQAKKMGSKISHITFDLVFISELPRTKETLLHSKVSYRQLLVSKLLNDTKTGMNDKKVSEYFRYIKKDPLNTTPPNGESLLSLHMRTKTFLDSVKNLKHNNILIISHGTIQKSLLIHLNNEVINNQNILKMSDNCELFHFIL